MPSGSIVPFVLVTFVQTAGLRIADDLATQRSLVVPMETIEVGRVPPGDGTEVDLELADVPMDAATTDEFVTAPATHVADPLMSSSHLQSY